MRKRIEWTHRLEDRTKRTVRVSFLGRNKIKWQFKLSTEERWDYDTPPSLEDWDALEKKMADRYQRRSSPYEDLELTRMLAKKARS